MKKVTLVQMHDDEINAVNGGAESGFLAGYYVAKNVGASDKTAATVGHVVSFIQDHITA